jgi:hypothetical protein
MTGSAVGGAALHAPSDWTRREERARGSRLRALGGLVAEAAVILGFVFVAGSILGIGAGDVRRLTQGESRKPQETIAGAAVAQPTGETEVTAPAAPSSSLPPAAGPAARPAVDFRMPRLVQPVFVRYGTAGALVLAGAFACGLLLLFGLRSRT